LYDELATLNEELAIIKQNIDLAITNGDSVGTLNSQKSSKQTEVSNKLLEISNIDSIIDDINIDILILKNEVDSDSHLTQSQLDELDPFIKYETFSDGGYSKSLKQDLLEHGIDMLGLISQPAYQFSIDSVDFLDLVEAQHDWGKFIIGDIINLKHTEINNMIVEARLVHYQYRPIEKELILEFSNKNNIYNPYTYNRDLFKKLSATSTSVDFSKYSWNKAPEAKTLISNYIDNELDLAKQSIIQSQDQDPILDNRGLWLKKKNPDNSYDPRQIRAVNNVIALTNDNWETVSTAITPDGIVAEKVYGKLGVFAEIDTHQVNVSNSSESVLGTLSNFSGISITSDDGIVIERNDGLVITTMNATEGIIINNGTDDIFKVDISGNLKMIGELQAGSIISDTSIVGGSIDIGSNFYVNAAGDMSASNATFSGNITGGSIDIGSNFYVSTYGNMSASNVSISGNITGGTIDIGSNFYVNSSGDMTANNATLSGEFEVYYGYNLVSRMYRDSIGGRYSIYDAQGNLNITIGVEQVGTSQTGGSVIIYDDDEIPRITMGLLEYSNDKGAILAIDARDGRNPDINNTAVILADVPSFDSTYKRNALFSLLSEEWNSRLLVAFGQFSLERLDSNLGIFMNASGIITLTDKYRIKLGGTTYGGYTGDTTIDGTTLSIKGGIIVNVT